MCLEWWCVNVGNNRILFGCYGEMFFVVLILIRCWWSMFILCICLRFWLVVLIFVCFLNRSRFFVMLLCLLVRVCWGLYCLLWLIMFMIFWFGLIGLSCLRLFFVVLLLCLMSLMRWFLNWCVLLDGRVVFFFIEYFCVWFCWVVGFGLVWYGVFF